jgi:hypothetical protein
MAKASITTVPHGPMRHNISWEELIKVKCHGMNFVLRHYATNRKVAGSSPNEVDFFS